MPSPHIHALIIGEVLLDLPPGQRLLGGAPANVAFRLNELQVPATLVSAIGPDEEGEWILDQLKQNSVDVSAIQKNESYKTGTVEVTIDPLNKIDYTICNRVAYEHIKYPSELIKNIAPSHVYFGTLIQREEESRNTLKEVLKNIPTPTIRVVDVNLRKDCYTKESCLFCLENANILKISEEEIQELARICEFPGYAPAEIAGWISKEFKPDRLYLTRGENGAALYTNGTMYENFGVKLETSEIGNLIGCGDSFCAAAIVSDVMGFGPEKSLEYCCEVASEVARTVGGMVPILNFRNRDPESLLSQTATFIPVKGIEL